MFYQAQHRGWCCAIYPQGHSRCCCDERRLNGQPTISKQKAASDKRAREIDPWQSVFEVSDRANQVPAHFEAQEDIAVPDGGEINSNVRMAAMRNMTPRCLTSTASPMALTALEGSLKSSPEPSTTPHIPKGPGQ